jgi:hypothetical protein
LRAGRVFTPGPHWLPKPVYRSYVSTGTEFPITPKCFGPKIALYLAGNGDIFRLPERKVMTRLVIDKQEVTKLPPDFTSLEEVVRLVESDHLSPDTVIRDIQIDGCALLSNDREPDWLQRIDDREVIEFFTSSLREVALESIREARVYLERMEAVIPSLAKSFRVQYGKQEFENLKQLYEGFYWLNLLLDRLERSFGIVLETFLVAGQSLREHHAKLANLLKEVIAAHEKRDFGLLGDLLEYEIVPMLPAWKIIFAAIEEKVSAKN